MAMCHPDAEFILTFIAVFIPLFIPSLFLVRMVRSVILIPVSSCLVIDSYFYCYPYYYGHNCQSYSYGYVSSSFLCFILIPKVTLFPIVIRSIILCPPYSYYFLYPGVCAC